jgi:hypothetical protein
MAINEKVKNSQKVKCLKTRLFLRKRKNRSFCILIEYDIFQNHLQDSLIAIKTSSIPLLSGKKSAL